MFTALLLIHGRAPEPPLPTHSKAKHALYGNKFYHWAKAVKQSMRVYGYPVRGAVFEFTQWYEGNANE